MPVRARRRLGWTPLMVSLQNQRGAKSQSYTGICQGSELPPPESRQQGFQILKNMELTQVAVQMLKMKEEKARGALRATKTALGLQILKNLTACQILQNQDENATEALAEIKKELEDAASRLKTGWKINGRNIYYFSTEKKNWTDAEEFCVSHDSHLASITTFEEQSFITDRKGRGGVWIGLTDEGSEGKWRFVDGSKYGDPLFWSEDNPDNWKDNEHCAVIRGHEDWNDADCALIEKWICKMPILQQHEL